MIGGTSAKLLPRHKARGRKRKLRDREKKRKLKRRTKQTA
jgi:hypothetical protein